MSVYDTDWVKEAYLDRKALEDQDREVWIFIEQLRYQKRYGEKWVEKWNDEMGEELGYVEEESEGEEE